MTDREKERQAKEFAEAVAALKGDPLKFAAWLWPDVSFYKKQREIIYSVKENDETFVPAGNKLGKDFVAAFIVLWFFLTRHPCKIVTTSAKDQHLAVLWGEIGNFIATAKTSLSSRRGGPLVITHQNLKKVVNGEVCKLSYCTGMVASQDSQAAMGGHHVAQIGDGIPRTLFVSDESSSVPTYYYTMAQPWMNRALVFGNCYACDNFFKHAVKGTPDGKDKGGDVVDPFDPTRFERKVIRIQAVDSPNVQLGLAEEAKGWAPSFRTVLKGVKGYKEYLKDKRRLSESDQCVKLEADFWEGVDSKLFPREWLDRAEQVAERLSKNRVFKRQARAMGVDPAEGGDSSAWVIVDERGVIYMLSMKTKNTMVVPERTLDLMKEYGVPAEMVFFDRGGGGKQHADFLRAAGFKVRTVGFGEPPSLEIKRVAHPTEARKDMQEEKYSFRNRRAQMYWLLHEQLDPALNPDGFGLPAQYSEIRRQLAAIPLWRDEEERLMLPPKHPKVNSKAPGREVTTLVSLLGCSPDEADALALANYGMVEAPVRAKAGGM